MKLWNYFTSISLDYFCPSWLSWQIFRQQKWRQFRMWVKMSQIMSGVQRKSLNKGRKNLDCKKIIALLKFLSACQYSYQMYISYLCTSVGNVGVRKWNLSGRFFFQVLVEIFSTYFSTRDKCRDIRRVSRKIVEKIEKSTRKKNLHAEMLIY